VGHMLLGRAPMLPVDRFASPKQRCKSRRRVGRPELPADIRDLVRTISRGNPLWGAPRVHGELLKLGIDMALVHL